MSIVASLAVVYGIKEIAREDVQTLSVLSIALGAAVGVAFARRQGRLEHPLLDVSLFRSRAFSTALVANVLGALTM